MKLLNVDTIEQAREKILSCVKSWTEKTKNVSLDEALDCILAEDLFASCDIPSFRRSTVDGYAVIASDTAGASDSIPVFLKQTSSVSMGKEANFPIVPGECVYVPTGGMLPSCADAVVMIEYCETAINDSEKKIISIYEAIASGAGTAEAGEDFQNGKLLLKRGTCIRPQETGALSAAGITKINIFVPLTVSIFSTGDELITPESDPGPGEIRDINTKLLKTLAVKNGYNVIASQLLPDDETMLEITVREALLSSDIVIISGGSSQGEKDFTAMIIDRIARPGVFTHGLAVKPGKPTIIGWDEKSKTLLAGLPGHPVSAMMVFKLFFGWLMETRHVKPGICKNIFPVPARISCNVPGSPGRTVCLPVVLEFKNDFYTAQPVFGKAGMISTLTQSNGYIIIDMNKEGLKKDEQVLVYLF